MLSIKSRKIYPRGGSGDRKWRASRNSLSLLVPQDPSPMLPTGREIKRDTLHSGLLIGGHSQCETKPIKANHCHEGHNTTVPVGSQQGLGSQEIRQCCSLGQCIFGEGEHIILVICIKKILEASQTLSLQWAQHFAHGSRTSCVCCCGLAPGCSVDT